jgi:hypothetical protein
MPETISQAYIFVPMLAVVFLTFIAFFFMSKGRMDAMKAGQDPAFYKTYTGTPEPEGTIVKVRHYNNMFEMPTVFYAGCITAYVLQAVSFWTVLFAWGYVALRLVQSTAHLTSNNTGVRGISFSISVLALLAMWVNVALSVFALL